MGKGLLFPAVPHFSPRQTLEEGEGSLFPFDLPLAAFPPERLFDVLQADVSEEAFHDKPKWAEPESGAWKPPLSQPNRRGFLFVSVC